MAESETAVCNAALGYLGQSPIVNLDDDLTNARQCKRALGPARRALIAEYPYFNFADRSQSVSATALTDAEQAVERWAYKALLPPEAIAVRSVGDLTGDGWEHRGRYLYCDSAPPLYLRFAIDETNPTAWPPLFDEALAYAIAVRIAYAVTGLRTREQDMTVALQNMLPKTKRADARESTVGRRPEAPWITARRGAWGQWSAPPEWFRKWY